MNAIVPAQQTQESNVHVYKPSKMLDPQRFDYLWKLTEIIARSVLVPLTIRGKKKGQNFEEFPPETIKANVFLVVEQADRWGISPFALIQASSIVHGKLCFEGKVIAGVLQEIAGINLKFEWNGQQGENLGCKIIGFRSGDSEPCIWPPKDSGKEWVTVSEWKTTGEGSPWAPNNFARQMMYRGAREWVRLYQPVILLGVFSDDEIEEIGYEAAARNARELKPANERFSEAQRTDTGAGFNPDNVTKALPDKRQVPMEQIKDAGEKVVAQGEKDAKAAQAAREAEADDSKSKGSAAETAPADRNGPGDEGSKSAEQPGSVPSGAEPGSASSAGATEAAGGSTPPAGGSFPFKEYSDALMRATQQKSLKALSDQYRTSHAWTTESGVAETLRKIYEAHQKRLKGELDQKMLAAELQELGAL